jgi:hypothetical protein
MKRFYSRFRVGLLAFALGLAAVYMAEGLSIGWGEVYVELPTVVSGNILPVFTETPSNFRREMNCGEDPSDERARKECVDRQLFGDRDLITYSRLEIVCGGVKYIYHGVYPTCDDDEARDKRGFVRQHWWAKTRAHLVVHYVNDVRRSESHYFIEPDGNSRWALVAREKSFRQFIIDGDETEVPVLDEFPRTYRNPRWKTAMDDRYFPPGTRYLEFENLTGDTVAF